MTGSSEFLRMISSYRENNFPTIMTSGAFGVDFISTDFDTVLMNDWSSHIGGTPRINSTLQEIILTKSLWEEYYVDVSDFFRKRYAFITISSILDYVHKPNLLRVTFATNGKEMHWETQTFSRTTIFKLMDI